MQKKKRKKEDSPSLCNAHSDRAMAAMQRYTTLCPPVALKASPCQPHLSSVTSERDKLGNDDTYWRRRDVVLQWGAVAENI